MEVCTVVQRVGNQVTEFGFEYFCLDYVSKIGVSVTECNTWHASLLHVSILTGLPPIINPSPDYYLTTYLHIHRLFRLSVGGLLQLPP